MSTMWPGSAGDSFLLQNALVWQKREELIEQNVCLLGDSAYPQLQWLMTPFDKPNCDAQTRYNISHKKGRSCVERCFGVMKSRFRCLQQQINYSPTKCSKIIMACACLHNLAIDRKINLDTPVDLEPDPQMPVEEFNQQDVLLHHDGFRRRNEIVDRVFRRV